MKTKIFVFGAHGQLGCCLMAHAKAQNIDDIFFFGKDDGDIMDVAGLLTLFESAHPDYVINCAAYTDVERAEEEQLLACNLNTDGARNIVDLCKAYDAKLIHISTDFVFPGHLIKLLDESDRANPKNNYGQTKFEGEQVITATTDEYFILRTSWLYSEYGRNFVKTMLWLATERDEVKVIVDQFGTPTYAMDLAAAIFHIIQSRSEAYGIYHYSNEGAISWYDFAKAIFDLSDTKVKVLPIKASEYPTRAQRPAFTVMNKAKFKDAFGLEIPYWRDSLAICIERIKQNI